MYLFVTFPYVVTSGTVDRLTDMRVQVRICIVRVGLCLLAGNETNLSCSNRFSLPLRLLLLSVSRAHIQPHRPIRSGA